MRAVPIPRDALVYAVAHRRMVIALCIGVWAAWLAVGFLSGPQYDYAAYMVQWGRVLAGRNPWPGGTSNAYGPGHLLLAPLFAVHPLAPKLLYILCWFGCFAVVYEARRRDLRTCLSVFPVMFATPFFVVLICIFGVEDALVTLLTLLAVDLRMRKAQSIAPAILLAAAVLTKLYPLALLPFLATDRGTVDVRFVAAFVLAFAGGFLLTVALWGWSILHIVEFASARDSKMLSIFSFLSKNRFSPLAGTAGANALLAWNTAIVIVAMASLYAIHFFGKMRALTGTVAAAIGLLAFYKVGNPQYFISPAILLIYFLAVGTPHDARRDRGLLIASASYLVVLNAFEIWYAATNGSYQFPQVRSFVGLPCFLAAMFLLWRLIRRDLRRPSG